jgi:hypothetical protein
MAKSYEEEDDIEDPPVEALTGHLSGTGESNEISDMLLGLIGGCSQLITLLLESDHEEFRRVRPRLELLRQLVSQLPAEAPRRKRAIGFVPPPKKGSGKRKADRDQQGRSRRKPRS